MGVEVHFDCMILLDCASKGGCAAPGEVECYEKRLRDSQRSCATHGDVECFYKRLPDSWRGFATLSGVE